MSRSRWKLRIGVGRKYDQRMNLWFSALTGTKAFNKFRYLGPTSEILLCSVWDRAWHQHL